MAHRLNAIRALLARLPAGTAANQIRSNLNDVEKASAELVHIRMNPSEMKSQIANAMDVTAAADRLRSAIASAKKNCDSIIEKYRADEASAQTQAARLIPNEFAAETRSVFRSLSADEKNRLLGDLIAAQDGPTLAALLDAPPMLSGLSSEQSAQYRQSYLDAVAPRDTEAASLAEIAAATIQTAEQYFPRA